MTLRSRAETLAPWLIVTLALALRVHDLGSRPLWFDEAYTAIQLARPVDAMLESLLVEPQAPLYYFLMWPWTALVGPGELGLRLPSALVGAATVGLLYVTGREMISRRAGLLTALLAAVSPLPLHYAREARPYALVALVAVAVLLATHRLLVEPDRRRALGVGLLLVAGLYLHYYFVLLVPLLGICVFAEHRRRAIPMAGLALLVVAIGFGPWLPTVLEQSQSGGTRWIGALWQERSLARAVPWSLECFGPGASYPPYGTFEFRSSTATRWLSLAIASGAFALAALRIRSRWPGIEARTLLLIAAAALGPLLGALLASLLRDPFYVVARYDMIAWGAYLLLVAAVADRLGRPAVLALALVWLLASAFTLSGFFGGARPELGVHAAEQLRTRADPGDVVVFAAGARTTTEYYLGEAGKRVRLLSYPLENDDHLGWIDPDFLSNRARADDEARRLGAVLGEEPPKTVWVVLPGQAEPLIALLEQRGYRRSLSRSTDVVLALQRR